MAIYRSEGTKSISNISLPVMSCRGLTRGGRHQTLDNGLKFKEITVGGDSEARRRFIVVFNYQTKTGKLRLDREKIKAEERLDGRFLVSTSDDGLSARDVGLGYKQLAVVERVFRDLRHDAKMGTSTCGT